LTASGEVRRRCRTLWRDGIELGVQWLPDRPEDAAAIVELNS